MPPARQPLEPVPAAPEAPPRPPLQRAAAPAAGRARCCLHSSSRRSRPAAWAQKLQRSSSRSGTVACTSTLLIRCARWQPVLVRVLRCTVLRSGRVALGSAVPCPDVPSPHCILRVASVHSQALASGGPAGLGSAPTGGANGSGAGGLMSGGPQAAPLGICSSNPAGGCHTGTGSAMTAVTAASQLSLHRQSSGESSSTARQVAQQAVSGRGRHRQHKYCKHVELC